MALATLPITYSDGQVLSASDLSSNFTALNNAVVGVANGGSGLSSGTSGGVLYYSAAATLASSGALTANALVLGGGAGAAPTTLAGTSGGIVYFSAANTAASSGALAAGAVVLGGGAGAAPTAVTLASARVLRTAGDVTTTNTSLEDIAGATSGSITTGARAVEVGFTGTADNNTAGQSVFFNIDIDGALQLGTDGVKFDQDGSTGSLTSVVGITFRSAALTAAAHTIKMQWKVGANTGTLQGDSARPFHFFVAERL